MLPKGTLSVFFKLLTFSGVLPISCSNKSEIISTKFDEKSCFLCYFLINILVLIIFLLMLNFRYEEEGQTIQNMTLIQETLVCILHIFTHSWYFFNRKTVFNIIKNIFDYKIKCNDNFYLKELKYNFQIFFACNFAFNFNSFAILTFLSIKFRMYILESFISMLSHQINYFVSSLILSFYSCLISKIQNIFFEINKRLELIMSVENFHQKYYFEFYELLQIRNNFLVLCEKDISFYFGFPFIFLYSFALFPTAHIIAIFIWREKDNETLLLFISNFILNSYYLIPNLIIHIRAFECNRLKREVRFSFLLNLFIFGKYGS